MSDMAQCGCLSQQGTRRFLRSLQGLCPQSEKLVLILVSFLLTLNLNSAIFPSGIILDFNQNLI